MAGPRDFPCVYVAIGWERAAIDDLHRSLPHATVVATPADVLPALHVLAPFAGLAIAEDPRTADDSWLLYRIERLVEHLDRPTVPPYARRKMIDEIARIIAPYEPPSFAVPDWKAWWESHATLSLEEIRQEVRTQLRP